MKDAYILSRIKNYQRQIDELLEKIKLCKNPIVIEIYKNRIEFFEKLKKELESGEEMV